MALIKTETAREVQTLQRIERNLERRDKIHRLLIAGLTTLLAVSVSIHAIKGCCRKPRRR
ncbi:MAG: hypothetical protein K2L16_10150 [Muribaculaceae bacterium]|nr:hypothetical protein [Muribaculaceae bacterium]